MIRTESLEAMDERRAAESLATAEAMALAHGQSRPEIALSDPPTEQGPADQPKMDILDDDPVTLSPKPGPNRVPVLKDGEALYATRGQALDRALAAGWKLSPGADREGDGALVEAAVRYVALAHPEDLLMALMGFFGGSERRARDLCARFGFHPETGEEVS